jgi:threonine aldolase
MEQSDFDLRRRCRKVLSYHTLESPHDVMVRLARHPMAQEPADYFGKGRALQHLEERTASLLGKEQAQYFQKGVIAQQCLLRAVCENSHAPVVALAPMSHIDFEEGNALEAIHGLRVIRLGRNAPFGAKDLAASGEKFGAVVVELPLRRAGYLMPSWEELSAISNWCRDNSVHFHIDGARIWEAAAGYGRQPHDIAALADSVYVSYYKGLGGLGGCALAGSRALNDKVQPWRARLGGTMSTAYPYILSALAGMDRHLPRISDYVGRARVLAAKIADMCIVNPNPPRTNAFQVMLNGTPANLREKHRQFATSEGVWLFNAFNETQLPHMTMTEIIIGDAADHYTDDEALIWIKTFIEGKYER